MPVESLKLSLMFAIHGSPEPSTGYLRGDLRSLALHFKEPLVDGLLHNNVQRVLEVGVGGNFEAMKQLSYQSQEGKPFFASHDIWAIDPDIHSEEFLRYLPKLSDYLHRFTRSEIDLEALAGTIKCGYIPPFDLIFSKGVVSHGSYVLGHGSVEERRAIGMGLIGSMRDCLNPINTDALLMVCAMHYDECLQYCKTDFEDLGLMVVHSETTTDPISVNSVSALQEKGIFRGDLEGVPYNLVICKKLPSSS